MDENVRTVGKRTEGTKEKTVNVEPKEKMIKKAEDPEKKNLESQETEESAVREFKKSSKLNNVLYDVRGPVVEEASRMEAAGTQVLKLNIGNPAPFGFRTPDEVIYDMRDQLTDCEGYSPAKGLFSARKAIMQYAQLKKIPNVSVDDIYTGNGVSELINLSMSALLDNGDEIHCGLPVLLWQAAKQFIISATNRQSGILIWMISEERLPNVPKRLYLSTRIILQVHYIQGKFFNRL